MSETVSNKDARGIVESFTRDRNMSETVSNKDARGIVESFTRDLRAALDSGKQDSAEKVDHPKHYNVGRFEVIDVIEDWGLGFNLGNVVKYVARAEHKGEEIEDLRKAAWYLNRQIELRTKEAARCREGST